MIDNDHLRKGRVLAADDTAVGGGYDDDDGPTVEDLLADLSWNGDGADDDQFDLDDLMVSPVLTRDDVQSVVHETIRQFSPAPSTPEPLTPYPVSMDPGFAAIESIRLRDEMLRNVQEAAPDLSDDDLRRVDRELNQFFPTLEEKQAAIANGLEKRIAFSVLGESYATGKIQQKRMVRHGEPVHTEGPPRQRPQRLTSADEEALRLVNSMLATFDYTLEQQDIDAAGRMALSSGRTGAQLDMRSA